MDTLRLVEVAGDGSLVLMTGDGRRFSLAVDEQVRSAVRRSRNGTHEPTPDDRPGPREVQARIRAGADAVQVAAQTGLDVDYVRRFEGPVLAERAHVADLARATAVDRGGDPTLSLERVVLDVLTGEGYAVDDIRWDSRKVEGSRWQVVVTSREGVARSEATWGFDTATRSLEPVDAEAERLTGVERRRRLSAVRETVFDVERPAAVPAGRGGTVELLDALARQRGRRPVARPADGPVDDGQAEGARPAGAPAGASGTGSTAVSLAARAGDTADARGSQSSDVGTADTGIPDTGTPDTGTPDAGTPDAGTPDAGTSDAGTPDAVTDSPAGAAVDAAPADTRTADPRVAAGTRASADDRTGDRTHGLRVVAAGRTGADRDQAELSIEPDLLTELELDQPPGRPAPREPVREPVAVAAGDRRGRRRRAAVPSWDEIVFGAKREDG